MLLVECVNFLPHKLKMWLQRECNLSEKIDLYDISKQIEIELKNLGLWSKCQPIINVSGAFGGGALRPDQWALLTKITTPISPAN
jgi:hypothetical protein